MGSGGSQSSSSSQQSYTPEQKKWLGKTLGVYGPELGQNNNVWQGDRLAGFGDLQSDALNRSSGLLDVFSSGFQDLPLFNQTGTTLDDLLKGTAGAGKLTQADTDAFFQGSIYDPTMKSLKQDMLPSVDESFAGTNFFGSGRAQTRNKMISDTSDAMAKARADLNWNVLGQNQALDEASANRMLTAVPQAMQYGMMPTQAGLAQLQGLGGLFDMGSAEQTQRQAEINTAIQKFAEENQITDPDNLAILMSLLNMNYSSRTENASQWDAKVFF